jgi:hypothetical protein
MGKTLGAVDAYRIEIGASAVLVKINFKLSAVSYQLSVRINITILAEN